MSLSAASRRSGPGFCVVFVGCVGLLSLGFSYWESALRLLYLYPVSLSAATLLDFFGVQTTLDTASLAEGFCALVMEDVVFHVTHECAGIFALFIYLAAVCAYPARASHKVRGVLFGIPLFFVYASCRLTLLGLIAQAMPTWLQFFHVYLLVILNLGFTMFLWATWVRRGSLLAEDCRR